MKAILGRHCVMVGLYSFDLCRSLARILQSAGAGLDGCSEGLRARLVSPYSCRFVIMGNMWCLLVEYRRADRPTTMGFQ